MKKVVLVLILGLFIKISTYAAYKMNEHNGETITVPCTGKKFIIDENHWSGSDYNPNDNYTITFCSDSGDPIGLSFSSLDANISYNVSYNGNSATSITADGSGNIIISGLGAGSYTRFIVETNGCSTTNSQTINLTDPNAPGVVAFATEMTICNGESTEVSATKPDGAVLTWDNGYLTELGKSRVKRSILEPTFGL